MGGPNPNPNPNSNHQIPKTAITSNPSRLKRENFQRTKHDKSFSKWKILIGPSDWEDYKANKEGAERYRVANLPSVCGPGLYEIGVAVCATGSGRDVDKLGSGSESIVVVYLGQADNVKSRLQHYGRSGSHLVNGFGLFKDVFSRGFPIVYRWAPMSSKSEAERTEAKLLERFDYAWNKVGNDARRPNDVLNKIEKISSQNTHIPKIVKMLQSLREQKVGIPIKAEKLPSFEKKPNYDIYNENVSFFDRIFKFSRSQPRLVPHFDSEVITEKMEHAHVCGVLLSDGSACNDPPVKGRKRCAKHKGRRLTSVSKTSIAIPSIERSSMDVKDDFPSICGVILLDGSPCAKPPFTGRKRCEEHKGMRVNHIMSKSLNLKLVTEKHHSNLDLVDYCGVNLGDGKFCDRQPVKGRKRCEQHKGKRVNAFASNLLPKNQWPNAGHNSVHALPIPDVSHT